MRIQRLPVCRRNPVPKCHCPKDLRSIACQKVGSWIVWGYYPDYSSLVVCGPCLEFVKLDMETRPEVSSGNNQQSN